MYYFRINRHLDNKNFTIYAILNNLHVEYKITQREVTLNLDKEDNEHKDKRQKVITKLHEIILRR